MGAGFGQAPPADQEVSPARACVMTAGLRHCSLPGAVNRENRPKIKRFRQAFRRGG